MKLFLIIMCLIFIASLFHYGNEIAQAEKFKVDKIPLVLGTKAIKDKKAERLYSIAVKNMDNKTPVEWKGPNVTFFGWSKKETIDSLVAVIKKYPESESAISAQLRLALVLDYTSGNIEWAKELYDEIEKKYSNKWQALCASYFKNRIGLNKAAVYEDDVDKIRINLENIENKVKNIGKYKNDKDFNEFKNSLSPDYNFELFYYRNLMIANCRLSRFDDAIKYANYVIDMSTDKILMSQTRRAIKTMMKYRDCPAGLAEKRGATNETQNKYDDW